MAWVSHISLSKNLSGETAHRDLKNHVTSADLATLRKHLTVLTEAGIIEDYKLPKETFNKKVRFCQDYQHFNQRTLPELYNDQHIERGLNCLVGNEMFTVLSVLSGVYQMPQITGERDLPYSVRPYGFYECERMQPGYCEKLASYQKLLEDILSDLNMVELLLYTDYIIIFAKSFEEHTVRLDKVFKRLQCVGLTVSLEQSLFCYAVINYAGHAIYKDGIYIDANKKVALANWPKPKTVSELQCYVDFCTYYRQFVSGFQDLAKPLNEILQEAVDHKAKNPGGPWWATESIEERWTKERDEAFYGFQEHLLMSTCVSRANMTQPKAPHEGKKRSEALC